MSENQYDTKLVTTANRKPRTRPCAPPSDSPRNSNSALSAPSSSAVLTVFDIGISILIRRAVTGAAVPDGRIIVTCSPLIAAVALLAAAAQTPAAVSGAGSRFHGRRPASARPAPPPRPAPAPPLRQRRRAAGARRPRPRRPKSTLGVPIYPGAQFIASYDAGRGQRYYMFGSAASFVDLVTYYRNALKQRGELVYEVPATHEFDVGRFDEETMAFPPGVTIKDFQSDVSQGYPNPKPGGQPARFPTIIQIVPGQK